LNSPLIGRDGILLSFQDYAKSMLDLYLQIRKDPDPGKKLKPCTTVNSVPVDYDLALMAICPSSIVWVLKMVWIFLD